MKFVYIGAGRETDAFNLIFPQGEAVEVTDAHAIAKLSNNPQFEKGQDDDDSRLCGKGNAEDGRVGHSKDVKRGRPHKRH